MITSELYIEWLVREKTEERAARVKAEGERDTLSSELSRCYALSLKYTGSIAVEPLDVWLDRLLIGVTAEASDAASHHAEHHEREAGLRKERDEALAALAKADKRAAFMVPVGAASDTNGGPSDG